MQSSERINGTLNGISRGDVIVLRAYDGQALRRRVWTKPGDGVLVCSEEEYRRAMATGDEPLAVGFPNTAILDVLPADAVVDEE